MHCSTEVTAPSSTDAVLDDWWRDERFRTFDPQRLLERLDAEGMLEATGPLLLLLRGSGAQQRLDGWCELRPDLPALEGTRTRDGGLSPYDLVMLALPHCGLREEDHWAPFGPERTRAVLVLRRTGRVVFGPDDEDLVDGLRYGTNHSGTDWSDCYLVTEHGWVAFLGGSRGEFGTSPALHASGTVGAAGQSGAS